MNGSCTQFNPSLTPSGVFSATHNGLTCQVTFEINSAGADEQFAVFASNTTYIYPGADKLPWQGCYLVHCNTLPDCTMRSMNPASTFTSISLTATTFTAGSEILPMLSVDDGQVVTPDAMLLKDNGATWQTTSTFTELNKPLFSVGMLALLPPN